ncbi:hypothetical protein C8J57DRAFT_1514071 [Mycena rebaudengoi]|nr:hypothetical protein C8J57DRAFT_1514071 [Mycena rebaudengoi]
MSVRHAEYGASLPTYLIIRLRIVNDAHDTTIDFAASFLEYWLLPLLAGPRVNDDETLILLTFDETETAVSNDFSLVAAKTGYKNVEVPAAEVPQFNLTGVASGPLTYAQFVPFAAPNLKARGAGRGPVLKARASIPSSLLSTREVSRQ